MHGSAAPISCLSTLMMAAAACNTCLAEQDPTPEDRRVAKTTAVSIAEVIVTARKREEAANQVPMSLSTRSGVELERSQSLRLQEIVRSIPNLSSEILNPRQASIAIRGLGRNPANDGLESSVGVFMDGVYLGRPGMAVMDFVDLERLEVLRGPQGTLFGKNTTAGLLSINTRAPTDSFETYVHATAGNQSHMQVHGAISGPLLTARLTGRLLVFTTRREGFVTNTKHAMDLGEFNRNAARAQLAWKPTSKFDLRLIADYGDHHEDGPGITLVDPGIRMQDGSVRPNNFLDRTARVNYSPQFRPFNRRNASDAEQRSAGDQGGVSAHARWQLGTHTLTSITAWRMWNHRPRSDGDFTPLDIQPQLHFQVSDEQVSTELQLSSSSHDSFRYQVGALLFGQNLTSEFVTSYGEHAADFAQPGLPSSALDGFEVRTISHPRTRSAAAFGQANWDVAKRWEVSAGLRWTTEEKESAITRTSSGGSSLNAIDAAAQAWRSRLGSGVNVKPSSNENFTSAMFSLSRRIGTNATAYLSASRGAKSGGINVAVVPSGIDQVLEPEVAMSYEIGIKQRWQELSLDLAAFEMQVDDYHATVRDPVRAATFLANAGKVRSRGFELEAMYQPSAELQLRVTAGWADARFTSFREAPCPPETVGRTTCDFSEARVPGAPPWTVDLGGEYRFPMGASDREVYLGGDWFHAAGYRVELSSYTAIDAYDIFNARAGMRSRHGRWDVWLWARNLLDENFYALLGAGGSFNSGVVYGLVGDPRTYGVSLRVSY